MSRFLIQMALDEGHDVALIESDEQRARQALEQYDILVFQASIGQGDIIQEAGAAKADALIATTDDDATNLMAMFIGTECNIQTLISIVNERTHQHMFERLNVHVLVDPAAITARYLYKLLITHYVEETVNLPGGETLFQTIIDESSSLVGHTPTEVRQNQLLPEHMFIVSVTREEEHTIDPADTLTLQAGDQVIVFSQTALDEADLSSLLS